VFSTNQESNQPFKKRFAGDFPITQTAAAPTLVRSQKLYTQKLTNDVEAVKIN